MFCCFAVSSFCRVASRCVALCAGMEMGMEIEMTMRVAMLTGRSVRRYMYSNDSGNDGVLQFESQ